MLINVIKIVSHNREFGQKTIDYQEQDMNDGVVTVCET